MQQVTFTLRTLTPLFLAGADPVQAELRPPAFRGLMRYWYRALVSGLVGADRRTLAHLIEAEKAVFGATDTGSAISIRVSEVSREPQQYRKESYSRASTSGKDYLLWSMAETRRGKPDYRPDRYFFVPGTTFDITLANRDDDDMKLQRALASFWLLTNLGGIGSRSRRCAGSLMAQVFDGDSADLPFGPAEDVEQLQQQLKKGIERTRQLAPREHVSSAPIGSALFDALTSRTCSIYILRAGTQPWRTSDDAMRAIGGSLQSYRSDIPMRDREIFGLPLGHNNDRHASPLLLRVTELQKGGYVGVAVIFKTGNPQHYARIEDWVGTFSGRVEVTF